LPIDVKTFRVRINFFRLGVFNNGSSVR
jgi:hypothetical protein